MGVEEELKNNQDVMIQLPWTVPQQPLYTASIQIDPKTQKIPLDITHSEDTTAISSFENSTNIAVSSFDYATGIAVFLALCATALAYWFGVRSFDLTKQSFRALVLEINAKRDFENELRKREIVATYFKNSEKFIKIARSIQEDKINDLENLIEEHQYLIADISLYYSRDNDDIDEIFNIHYAIRFLMQCVIECLKQKKKLDDISIKAMIQINRESDIDKQHLDMIELITMKFESLNLVLGIRELSLRFLNEFRDLLNKKAA